MPQSRRRLGDRKLRRPAGRDAPSHPAGPPTDGDCGTLGVTLPQSAGKSIIMLVWIALALLTGAAVLAVLLPLSRADPAGDAPDETATDAAFYKTQLAEIERDAERGLIDPADAETARVEAARRLLAATRRERQASVGTQSLRRRKIAVADRGDRYPARQPPAVPRGRPARSCRTSRSPRAPTAPRIRPRWISPRRWRGSRRTSPRTRTTARGYEVIGPVYMNAGRYEDAVRAFAARSASSARRRPGWRTTARPWWPQPSGVVTADARKAFERALQLDPKAVKARFYRAVAAEQEGDTATAVATYRSMAADAPPGSALASTLEQRLVRTGRSARSARPCSVCGSRIRTWLRSRGRDRRSAGRRPHDRHSRHGRDARREAGAEWRRRGGLAAARALLCRSRRGAEGARRVCARQGGAGRRYHRPANGSTRWVANSTSGAPDP